MRTLHVAAIQLLAHDRSDFTSVWKPICNRVEEAARGGAQLIVLPEGTIPGYVLGEQPLEFKIVENAIAQLRDIASSTKAVIVCGIARTDGNKTYNSAIVIEKDGVVAGYADKAFLWHFDRRWFAPGERIQPISTSVGKLGVLICADGRMPMIASELVDAGAEILVMPTAWVTSERDLENLENIQADLLARIRARENNVPFIAANKCGTELGCVAYCGKSQIIAADGTILAIASQNDPEIITTSIIPNEASKTRSRGIAMTIAIVNTFVGSPIRIAIAAHNGPYIDDAMHIIEATQSIAPDATDRIAKLNSSIPTTLVDDATIADPVGLIPYRRAEYRLIVWDARSYDPAWIAPLARARAAELKLYIVVLDRMNERAFAIDPDGIILASTTRDYPVANFVLDPVRTKQTLVAPGTDIAEGIERIITITQKERT